MTSKTKKTAKHDQAAPRPQRIQLRRVSGWRKPEGAVVVARPTKWGNPYTVAERGRARAVELYREHLLANPGLLEAARAELAGHDLACWCELTDPCHADVLLELANAPVVPGRRQGRP
jgi:Domain of unknown function (DUF4326)